MIFYNNNDLKKLEDSILELLKLKYLPKGKRFSLNFYAQAADEISKSFTSERSKRAKNYFNQPANRAAYLLYFYLQTYVKSDFCISRATELGFINNKTLDIGSGSGAAALAALNKDTKNLTIIDQNKKALLDASFLLKQYSNKQIIKTLTVDALKWKSDQRYDQILMVNFLNELEQDKQYKICTNLINNALTINGCLIIIEPALRFITRNLMKLRNALLEHDLFIHAPCLHQDKCPMLTANKRDWCHMYLKWNLPNTIKELDALTNRNHRYLKFSYLIISKTKPKKYKNKGLIVSSPLISKGKTELLTCCYNGKLTRLRELHRDTSKCLNQLTRGDIVDL